MKVAYLSQYDAKNIRAWSGTGYYMAHCLQDQGIGVDYIGPLKNQRNPINIARYLINKKLLKRNDHPQRDRGFLRSFARQSDAKLRDSDADLIFTPSGLTLSYLETRLPVVLWTDCTFANLVDYYPAFSNLSKRTIRNGHDAERRTLSRCDLLLFSSQWAADSAIQDYGVDPARVRVVSLGSNMPDDLDAERVETLIQKRIERLNDRITLFCSGVDWYRKGVDIAVQVLEGLTARGIKAELLVGGCQPPAGTTLPDAVQLLGFIPKNQPEGMARLRQIYSDAHFFLLPTRADCTPMVLAEAASFGLPALATRTGGIASMVHEDVNGWTFPPEAPVQKWVDRIATTIASPDHYAAVCRSSRAAYESRLNWNAAGRIVAVHLEELLAARAAPAS